MCRRVPTDNHNHAGSMYKPGSVQRLHIIPASEIACMYTNNQSEAAALRNAREREDGGERNDKRKIKQNRHDIS